MQQLKLLIDARKLGDGGIGVYLENLVRGLLELRDLGEVDLKLTLLISSKLKQKEQSLLDFVKELKELGVRLVEDSSKLYSFAEYFLLGIRHKQLFSEHDVFHSPHYTLPFFIKIPKVVTIHDVIHIDQPANFWHKPVSSLLINSALRRASALITVSNYSKQRLQAVFPKIANVHVVYNALQKAIRPLASSPRAEIRKKFSLNIPTFLFVGSDKQHKGFEELLRAWRLLKELSKKDAQLFVVGGNYSAKTKQIAETLSLNGSVHFLGELNAVELNQLYNAVSAVVISSKEEGFGLVALEALCCNTPVISTPLASIKEFSQNSPGVLFSKDYSPEEIARSLAALLNQKFEFPPFSFDPQAFERTSFARKTCQIYQRVSGKNILTTDVSSSAVYSTESSAEKWRIRAGG